MKERDESLLAGIEPSKEELYSEFEEALDQVTFGVANKSTTDWYMRAVKQSLESGEGFGSVEGWRVKLFACFQEWREEQLEKERELEGYRKELEKALFE